MGLTRNFDLSALPQTWPGAALHQVAPGPMNRSEAIMGHHRTALILGGFIAVGAPSFSSAQTAESETPHGGDALQAIVVTAERREEHLQSVPISVAVVMARPR